jgi:hypothetical protein
MRKLQGRISKSPIPDQKKVSPSRGAGGKFTSRPAEQSAPLANQEHWGPCRDWRHAPSSLPLAGLRRSSTRCIGVRDQRRYAPRAEHLNSPNGGTACAAPGQPSREAARLRTDPRNQNRPRYRVLRAAVSHGAVASGNDLTRRFPLIVEALGRLRPRSCIIDVEAVACGDDGIACFELIRRTRWLVHGMPLQLMVDHRTARSIGERRSRCARGRGFPAARLRMLRPGARCLGRGGPCRLEGLLTATRCRGVTTR